MANNVLEAQKMLTKLGYAPGPVDGSYGSKTKNALENFYAAQNKKFDGELSVNEITSLTKALKYPNFSFEALKMMDDHVEQSDLLKVPLPKSNLVIKDYQRFQDYRLNHYKDNYSFANNLWKEKGSSGQILNKKYCYDTLVDFLIPAAPNLKFMGRSETDFTKCQSAFLTFGVIDFNASFKMYQKLFLEMATSEKDQWVYRRSNVKNNNPTFYHLGGVIATFYMYYAVNYEAFNYTKRQRNIIENYFKKKAFAERFNLDGDRRTSLCPIKNPMSLNKRIHITINCGSVRLRFAAGELALAIVTQDRALWKKGLWDLDYALSMTNDEGFFVPLSAKGCRALGYTWDTSRLFSLNVEMLKLAGYNLLDYKTRHGKTISQAYEMLFKQYEDITISNHIAKKAIGADSCGKKPFKTHKEFLFQEFGALDNGSLNDEWVPGVGRFINWTIRFTSEKHPEWIKANSLRDVETDPFIGNYHTVTAFEIYNANIMSEPKSIWKNKFKRENEALIKKEEVRRKKEEALTRQEKERQLTAELLNKQINEIVPVSFGSVYADVSKRDGNYQQVFFSLKKLSVGGQSYSNRSSRYEFTLMIDYAPKSSSRGLTELLRIQVSNNDMIPKSELANLENCKSILWKKTKSGIKLHFLIGNEAEINPCILQYVQPDKRNILGSIANALPEILEAGLAKKPEQLDDIMVLLNDARQREE